MLSKDLVLPLGREVFFDQQGNALRLRRTELARRLGSHNVGFDPVRQLGYVRIRPAGSALVVEFDPARASPVAVGAAFYEIADRAPSRIVLNCRGRLDWFETYQTLQRAFHRIDGLTTAS